MFGSRCQPTAFPWGHGKQGTSSDFHPGTLSAPGMAARAGAGWGSLGAEHPHPTHSHPHHCFQNWHAANPPGWAGGAGFLWCVRGDVQCFISQQAPLSSVVITCLLQDVKIEMYGCGNPSLKAQPVLLREWLNSQANPHHTFLHVFHHL